jgi:hypothetical protein
MNQALEEEMLSAYIAATYPQSTVYFHVRIGSIPDIAIPGLDAAATRRLMLPGLPELDAIVLHQGETILIEAKVAKEWDNLGKMLIYRYLLPLTPGWEHVDVSKLKLLMVLGRASPLLKQTAAAMGVSIAVAPTARVTEILTLGFPSQR